MLGVLADYTGVQMKRAPGTNTILEQLKKTAGALASSPGEADHHVPGSKIQGSNAPSSGNHGCLGE